MIKVSFGLNNPYKQNDTHKFNGGLPNLKLGEFVKVDDKGVERIGIVMGVCGDNNSTLNNLIRRATKEEIKQFWEDAEDNLLEGKLELSKTAWNYYRNNFKDCITLSHEEARRKITRNIILSMGFGFNKVYTSKGAQVFRYGSMKIRVKGWKVVEIMNHKPYSGFRMNQEKREYLDEVLFLK